MYLDERTLEPLVWDNRLNQLTPSKLYPNNTEDINSETGHRKKKQDADPENLRFTRVARRSTLLFVEAGLPLLHGLQGPRYRRVVVS